MLLFNCIYLTRCEKAIQLFYNHIQFENVYILQDVLDGVKGAIT